MKYTISMIVLLNSLLLFGQTPSSDENWSSNLFFEDNFNSGSEPNSSIWHEYNSGSEWTWQWNTSSRREYFDPNNVYLSGGYCVFKAEEDNSLPYGETPQFRVGGVITTQRNFPYGYYEIKWELPDCDGRWLSFWLYGSNAREIDIVENKNTLNNVWGSNVHNPPFHASNDIEGWGDITVPEDFTSENTIGLEWSPEILIFYLNNKPYKEILYNSNIPDPVNMGLIITPGIDNQANPNLSVANYAKTNWVKVHTLKRNINDINLSNNGQLSMYDFALNRTITLSNIDIPNSENMTFRATESITIEGEFTIPIGSEFLGIVHEDVQ